MAIANSHTSCPSCGRPTLPTAYEPEPSLCAECQRAYGVAAPVPTWPEPTTRRAPVAGGLDPENPVWGVFAAFGLWFVAMLALDGVFSVASTGYLFFAGAYGRPIPTGDVDVTEPGLALTLLASSMFSHVITFAIAWWVVTDGGKLPFLKSLGWSWPRRLGPGAMLGLAVALYLLGGVIAKAIGEPEDVTFSKMIESSLAARVTVSLLAVLSAPLVEEIVYRGVLYPALARGFASLVALSSNGAYSDPGSRARAVGRIVSILFVSALFVLPHAQQYDGSPAILVPLGILSLTLTCLRAWSGSLLPSIALHLFFNSITVFFLMLSAVKP